MLIIKSHIITAAMDMLGMETMGEIPSSQFLPEADTLLTEQADYRKEVLHTVTMAIIDKYIDLNFNTSTGHDQDICRATDNVQLYAKHLLSLGCFYLEFSDSIKGDGTCVLCC